MADAAFRAQQWQARYAPQVVTVNRFVDELRADGRDVPYLAPHYDAREARVLSLSSNPGPRAGGVQGSGLLSFCNDDPSAQRMLESIRGAALSDVASLPWNIHPWHVHDTQGGGLRSSQITEGIPALVGLLSLTPSIRCVVLHGGEAQTGWKRLTRTQPEVARRYSVWSTFHTSNRAFAGCSREVREQRLAHLTNTYREVASAVSP